jgi:hypothetical protein
MWHGPPPAPGSSNVALCQPLCAAAGDLCQLSCALTIYAQTLPSPDAHLVPYIASAMEGLRVAKVFVDAATKTLQLGVHASKVVGQKL